MTEFVGKNNIDLACEKYQEDRSCIVVMTFKGKRQSQLTFFTNYEWLYVVSQCKHNAGNTNSCCKYPDNITHFRHDMASLATASIIFFEQNDTWKAYFLPRTFVIHIQSCLGALHIETIAKNFTLAPD